MPIYAYRCDACGHAKDVLQKMSDPVLSTCPACGAEAFQKQLTAAGFQLKGSGWYVTDFKGGANGAKAADAPAAAEAKPGEGKAGEGKAAGDTKPAEAPSATAPAASGGASSDGSSGGSSGGSAPVAAAGGSCGGGCASH